jgi:hypothetical protein
MKMKGVISSETPVHIRITFRLVTDIRRLVLSTYSSNAGCNDVSSVSRLRLCYRLMPHGSRHEGRAPFSFRCSSLQSYGGKELGVGWGVNCKKSWKVGMWGLGVGVEKNGDGCGLYST